MTKWTKSEAPTTTVTMLTFKSRAQEKIRENYVLFFKSEVFIVFVWFFFQIFNLLKINTKKLCSVYYRVMYQ